MVTRKSCPRLGKFAINGAKGLLQQYLPQPNSCIRSKQYPGGRTLRSCLEGQPNILLRQRRLGVLGGLQIVELVQPHVLFERRF